MLAWRMSLFKTWLVSLGGVAAVLGKVDLTAHISTPPRRGLDTGEMAICIPALSTTGVAFVRNGVRIHHGAVQGLIVRSK